MQYRHPYAQLEQDLLQPHTTIRYTGVCSDLETSRPIGLVYRLPSRVMYRPLVVVQHMGGARDVVPLDDVDSICVVGETEHPDPEKRDKLIIAVWARAPWGELLRFVLK